jgi:hypothetical protein
MARLLGFINSEFIILFVLLNLHNAVGYYIRSPVIMLATLKRLEYQHGGTCVYERWQS